MSNNQISPESKQRIESEAFNMYPREDQIKERGIYYNGLESECLRAEQLEKEVKRLQECSGQDDEAWEDEHQNVLDLKRERDELKRERDKAISFLKRLHEKFGK